MPIHLRRFPTGDPPAALSTELAAHIQKLSAEAIRSRGRFAVAFSGGYIS